MVAMSLPLGLLGMGGWMLSALQLRPSDPVAWWVGALCVASFMLVGLVFWLNESRLRRQRCLSSILSGRFEGLSTCVLYGILKRAFLARGYPVSKGCALTQLAGAPLVVWVDCRPWLVQCKYWKSPRLGVEAVHELKALIHETGSHGGFLVTVGDFSEAAVRCASPGRIELLDRSRLRHLVSAI
jgi:hypothetical protein